MRKNMIFIVMVVIIMTGLFSYSVSIEEIKENFENARYDEVIKKASELLEEEEDIHIIAEALYYRGLSYQAFDKMKWALEDLKMATEFERDNLLYNRTLGQVYFELEMEVEAKSAFQSALSIDPDDVPSLIGLGYILLREGELMSAYNNLTRVVEMGEADSQVYSNLGYIDFQWGNLDIAENYLKKAVELDPDNLNALFTLGMILVSKDDYVRASDVLMKVVNNAPDDVEARILLAKAYEESGFKEAAIEQLETVLEVDRENKEVSEWLDRLKGE